ncbi:RNA polymerase factor sigma-70 [Marinobacterium jannaschii]|uniref:RNA polymerase factor sigma-70 n=1 Tax=Marinobacterium jannaschii TaxID=64970 RepID=UPI00048650A5|nr:RNA polymerase factor sigma-70 [Marinobacterium jannaschii]
MPDMPQQPDSPSTDPSGNLNDNEFLAGLRSQMLKFALLQLGDQHEAEDAVQEALAGALKNADAFARRAALKTWVFAILKHKIADSLRQKQKFANVSPLLRDDQDEAAEDALRFDDKGRWHRSERPNRWQQPEQTVEDSHFWRTFDACLNGLPEKQARLFMMREFIELSSNEICHNEAISQSNLHVILYRARLRLRDCLDSRWFNKEPAS